MVTLAAAEHWWWYIAHEEEDDETTEMMSWNDDGDEKKDSVVKYVLVTDTYSKYVDRRHWGQAYKRGAGEPLARHATSELPSGASVLRALFIFNSGIGLGLGLALLKLKWWSN
jgi:hypothetical protein